MQYNACHNRNIKLIITILQKYSTRLHMLAGIETKFELNLNCKLRNTENKIAETVVGRFP
jgi:hypothetical protein